MGHIQVKHIRAWHEELVEFMIANPRAGLKETSLYFNVSMAWISTITHTDAFRELWNKRRGEHFDNVSMGVSSRVTALAEVTVNALTEKIEKEIKADTITIDTLKEVSETALKALGFGGKGNSAVIHNNFGDTTQNNVFIDKETLAKAREARRKLQLEAKEEKIIEHNAFSHLLTNEIEGAM